MVELYDSATQHGPQGIEELPPSVEVYQYKGMDDFCLVLSLQHNRLYSSSCAARNSRARAIGGSCEGRQDDSIMLPQTEGTRSDHIIFIIQPLTFTHEFRNSTLDRPFHARLSFNPKTNILVVKMPLPAQSQAVAAFDDTFKPALRQMDLHKAIFS